MDEQGIQLADQQRDEHEVELILGALPSLWHNTQNVLRDLGYQQAPAPEADEGPQLGQPNDGPAAWRSDDKTAAAPNSPGGSDDDGDEKVCRMCFSSEAELADDGSSLGRLIRPCYCDGSMRYVHDTCLDQWRRKAEASEAARVCGQCHARYRFRRRPHANLMAFVQASQMLRILVCVLAIFILSVAFGMVALLSLKTVALLGSTPLGFVRDAALRRVHVNSTPWNITLQPDKARAEVWIPAETWKHSTSTGGMPRLDEEFYSKIDLEVFARVRQEQLLNPVYWKRVQRLPSSYRANYTDAMIVRAKLQSGEDVSEELERLSRGLPLFPWKPTKRSASEAGAAQDGAHPSLPVPERESANISSPSSQTPFNLTPSLRERLVGSDFKFKFGIPFLSSHRKESDADTAGHEEKFGVWQRQNMTIKFDYEELSSFILDEPSEHVLVRSLPEWLGFARYVPYCIVLALVDRFYFLASVFRPWWSSIARSALQLALLLLESHRELLWCASKAAVAALVAYVDVEFEPVRFNPDNAVIVGPPRTRRRRAAAMVREVLVVGADTVFGPMWLNWWGGYSLAVYMRPRQFMTTERVEMTQLAAVFAPNLTVLLDAIVSGLASFSTRAERFKTTTDRWTHADWVHHDYSASEGYRRMIATLLGDKQASKATLHDLWLEAGSKRLLPGRTKPLQMALMPKLSMWKTAFLLGCLVTTALALVVATKMAWDSTISHFARQAWRSLVSIWQLALHSGDSLRVAWRQTVSSVLFIARWTLGRARCLASQLVRSVKSAARSVRSSQESHSGTEASDRQDSSSSSTQHTDADGAAEQAEQAEAMPEPLLNDPFIQGGHMGVFGAILGHVASIYGCIHAFVFTMRFILVYLPFEPFVILYSLLQQLIQVDVANTEVLDREDVDV